jgi:thioredoxin 1
MKEISEGEFDTATAEGVVLVDFGAEWCAPCKAMLPVLKKLSSDYEGRVSVYSVDIDRFPSLAAKNGVMSVPTLLVFQAGRQVERIVGAVTEGNLRKKIEPFVGAA